MQNSVTIMQKQKLSDVGDLWHNLGGGNTQIITQRFRKSYVRFLDRNNTSKTNRSPLRSALAGSLWAIDLYKMLLFRFIHF